MPLRPSDPAIARGVVNVEVSDAESLPGTLRFVAETPEDRTRLSTMDSWLGGAAAWRGYRATERPRNAPGLWVAELPLGEREPAQVRIEGRTFVMRWLDSDDDGPGSSPSLGDAALTGSLLRGRAASPLERWRTRLATAGVVIDPPGQDDAFNDPVVEGLARQIEMQWHAALRRVDEADAALGRRLRQRLAGIVRFDDTPIPVWVEPRERLETLRRELLAEGLSPGACAGIALDFLDAPGPAGAVIRDEATAINIRTGAAYPSVLLVNMSSTPAAAWLGRRTLPTGATPGEMLRLDPMAARTLTFPGDFGESGGPAADGRASGSGGLDAGVLRFECGVGDWVGERVSTGRMAGVRPPGVAIGPLLTDWTQETFVLAMSAASPSAALRPVPASTAVVGRLSRGGEAGGRWTLFLEAAMPPASASERSIVAVHIGSASRAMRIEIDLEAQTQREFRAGVEAGSGRSIMTRSTDRASVWVTIPADAIEPGTRRSDGVLRLGVVRQVIATDGRVIQRGAWPRPMFPWEREPSRVALDLSTWAPANE